MESLTPGFRISVVNGPDAGATTMPKGARVVLLGRSEGADVRLSDPNVAPFHVELLMLHRGFEVRALDPQAPVAHAGGRIERATVPAGAILDIGRSVIRVDLDAPNDPPRWDRPTYGALRGQSPAMRALFVEIDRLTRKETSVLVEGPVGSGKTLVTRVLHSISRRAGATLAHLDCAAVPASLVEAALFSALSATAQGTLVLDEIDALPLHAKARLAAALEKGEVKARLLCTTTRSLYARINRGDFREELHRRVATARLRLLSLEERPEDITLLSQYFLSLVPGDQPAARAISSEALSELQRRQYPENVRGLREMVERAAAVAEGDVVEAADLAFERILARRHFSEATASSEFERGCLQRLMMRAGNHLDRAAAVARVDRESLRALISRHGLPTE